MQPVLRRCHLRPTVRRPDPAVPARPRDLVHYRTTDSQRRRHQPCARIQFNVGKRKFVSSRPCSGTANSRPPRYIGGRVNTMGGGLGVSGEGRLNWQSAPFGIAISPPLSCPDRDAGGTQSAGEVSPFVVVDRICVMPRILVLDRILDGISCLPSVFISLMAAYSVGSCRCVRPGTNTIPGRLPRTRSAV